MSEYAASPDGQLHQFLCSVIDCGDVKKRATSIYTTHLKKPFKFRDAKSEVRKLILEPLNMELLESVFESEPNIRTHIGLLEQLIAHVQHLISNEPHTGYMESFYAQYTGAHYRNDDDYFWNVFLNALRELWHLYTVLDSKLPDWDDVLKTLHEKVAKGFWDAYWKWMLNHSRDGVDPVVLKCIMYLFRDMLQRRIEFPCKHALSYQIELLSEDRQEFALDTELMREALAVTQEFKP